MLTILLKTALLLILGGFALAYLFRDPKEDQAKQNAFLDSITTGLGNKSR